MNTKNIIIGVLVIAVAYLAYDKWMAAPAA